LKAPGYEITKIPLCIKDWLISHSSQPERIPVLVQGRSYLAKKKRKKERKKEIIEQNFILATTYSKK